MTNDELQALVESNARAIAALASEASAERQQRSTNTDEIDTLLGAVSSNEVACRELRGSVAAIIEQVAALAEQAAESNRRFDILREDAIADRKRSDAQFRATLENMQRLFLELNSTNRRVENLEQAS